MTAVAKLDLTIIKGKTFEQVIRWEAPPIIYKPISAITNAAPVVITATSHDIPDGWRVSIQSVKGMTEINAQNDPPRCSDTHQATVLTSDTIALNTINSLDYKTYTSGGVIRYNTPVDLDGYEARMKIKDHIGGTTILSFTSDLMTDGHITIDNMAKTITLEASASVTAAITAQRGVYDLEMISGDVVTALLTGRVFIQDEVTT